MEGGTRKSDVIDGPWDKAFLNVIEQACERAIERLFPGIRDEAIKQALAQGFLAGVDWCFSEQSDEDIAEAALAIGVSHEEAATGALRKAR
jgi:hypothetical protein